MQGNLFSSFEAFGGGWRGEGIKHTKNEIFLDVIERLNILVSHTGNVLRSEVLGRIHMRSFLTGMPELKLGLNDKVLFDMQGRSSRNKLIEMEDIKFHQCVRLARFENDRTISFVPPDGEFELMSYRLNTHVKPLVWVEGPPTGRHHRHWPPPPARGTGTGPAWSAAP